MGYELKDDSFTSTCLFVCSNFIFRFSPTYLFLNILLWNVFEEVHCINPSRSTQRIDILVFKNKNDKSYILDPTIRFETGGNQPEEVNLEKKAHYDSVIPYFKDKYKLADIEVIGLFIGARGTISLDFENFRTKFDLSKEMRNSIALSVIKSSVQILQHHTYNL